MPYFVQACLVGPGPRHQAILGPGPWQRTNSCFISVIMGQYWSGDSTFSVVFFNTMKLHQTNLLLREADVISLYFQVSRKGLSQSENACNSKVKHVFVGLSLIQFGYLELPRHGRGESGRHSPIPTKIKIRILRAPNLDKMSGSRRLSYPDYQD